AVLRRQPQGWRLHAHEVHGREVGRPLAVCLQAFGQEAALRRHPQDAGMKSSSFALAAPLGLALGVGACGGGGDSAEVGRAYCPPPLTVQDAQRLTHFKEGAGRDPRDIAYEAAITASGTTCELSRG